MSKKSGLLLDVRTAGAMSILVRMTARGICRAQAMEMCSLVMSCTPMFDPTSKKAKSGSMPVERRRWGGLGLGLGSEAGLGLGLGLG